jgi:hypothetical protein
MHLDMNASLFIEKFVPVVQWGTQATAAINVLAQKSDYDFRCNRFLAKKSSSQQ